MTQSLGVNWLLLALSWAVCACHSERADPAPAPAKFEVVSAAPGARGARAAGTDAAPPAPGEGDFKDPSSADDDDEEAEPALDAGPGDTRPDAAPGVAL